MKKTPFSEEQMIKILREPDKEPVAEVARKHGTSDVTINAWRKRFGRLESGNAKRCRSSAAHVDAQQKPEDDGITHNIVVHCGCLLAW